MAPTKEENSSVNTHENIKLMGLLNLVGTLLGSWWWLAVIVYYILKKSTFVSKDIKVFNDIINFHLSFLIYFIVSAMLIFVLIGFVLLILTGIAYVIILVLSTLKYVNGEEYEYPMVIQFLK